MSFENPRSEPDASHVSVDDRPASRARGTEQHRDIGDVLLAQLARRARADREADPGGAPFSRIGGKLAIFCSVDLRERTVTDAASMATVFRGYDALLVKRDLREAGLISSTASGICGGVHATASSLGLEMALGIRPPPLGIVARNLLLSCQYLNDNPMQLFIFSGPDYSEATIRRTNPEIWALAEHARAPGADVHGYATIGALMTDLNRGTGRLFVEALTMIGRARAAYAVLGGKYPHSESIVPGGVALDLTQAKLDQFADKLRPFADYAKRCISIWDDVFDFLYQANPLYRHVGEAPATMVDFGQWDHEEFYDGSYDNCDVWGEHRWSTPGAIVGGKLMTTRLTDLNVGLEEFVDRSFYDAHGEATHPTDPLGNPLSRHHPWNKRVVPNAHKVGPKPPYSWANATTWQRRTFEVGAYARIYLSALGNKLPRSDHFRSTGSSLVLHLPTGDTPALQQEWKIPDTWNAFERTRARAYAVAFNFLVTVENLERARRLLARGESQLATPFVTSGSGERFGAGLCGAGRGFLGHWAVIRDGVLTNYQISVPSRINAGPRAPWGELGACERAVLNTPVIESSARKPSDFHGIDILRAIQSFDPCMPCTAHLVIDGGPQVLERAVTTDGP